MKLLRRPSSRKSKKPFQTDEKSNTTTQPLDTLSSEPGDKQVNQMLFPTTVIPEEERSRRSSTASANKPLPTLPPSRSSPSLTAKQSPPNLRKLALSTATSPKSLFNPLPPSAPYLQPASNSSENWTGPEDADGAYIRKTYAHFDVKGIKGDGLVEGKEWTRERGARAAWDASESAARPSSSAAPQSVQNHNGEEKPNQGIGIELSASSHGMKDLASSYTSMEYLNSPSEAKRPSSTNQKLGFISTTAEESFGASTSSLGSHSVESVSGVFPADAQGDINVADNGLEAERREMIKNIDRYGFFNKEGQNSQSTRSRLTVLPATSMQSIPKKRIALQGLKSRNKDSRGNQSSEMAASTSMSADDSFHSSSDKSPSHKNSLQSIIEGRENKELALREREALRVAKWDRMLEVKKMEQGASYYAYYALLPGIIKSKKFRKRVYKGIPDRWRSAVWWAILLDLSKRPASLSEMEYNYKGLIDVPSTHDVQIDLDVPRTISGHVLFHTRYGQGQRSLFHVLHAFSLLCNDCAYCQGMGPIVATLLVYFTPEKSYSIMVELHKQSFYGLHQTFSPGFPGLVESFYVQQKMCERLCPDLIASLESNGVFISSYATKWYITLYTNVLPFSTQLRLWDCFLLQGKDLLVVIAIAILWSLRDELLGGGFESAMKCLTREFIPVDDDAFLNWIFQVMEREDTRKRMTEARHEYRRLVKEGKQPNL